MPNQAANAAAWSMSASFQRETTTLALKTMVEAERRRAAGWQSRCPVPADRPRRAWLSAAD